MRHMILCLQIIFASIALQAQSKYVIRGKILQHKTLEPVAGASIFISNSAKGAVSGKDGSFEIVDAPGSSTHQLVVSCIGYGTEVLQYTAADLPIDVDVHLKQKSTELESVVVEPDMPDGWKRYGSFFVQHLIGTTRFAGECELKNHKVLRFRFSKKNNTLTVIADEPLIIENKALGYTIQYQLEEFQFDFSLRMLAFVGYAYFKEMPTEKEKTKTRWVKNREEAYKGSIQHFMKSLYENRLAEEGFEVRRILREPNVEKARVRKLMDEKIKAQRERGLAVTLRQSDSTEYYQRILGQPDEKEIYETALLTADSLLTTGRNSEEKILFFTDYLDIVYKGEPSEDRYYNGNFAFFRPGQKMEEEMLQQRSKLSIPNLTPITVTKEGLFDPLFEVVSFGYWAWSEKLAGMRPMY